MNKNNFHAILNAVANSEYPMTIPKLPKCIYPFPLCNNLKGFPVTFPSENKNVSLAGIQLD